MKKIMCTFIFLATLGLSGTTIAAPINFYESQNGFYFNSETTNTNTWIFDLNNDNLLSHWDGQGYDPYGNQVFINPEDNIISTFVDIYFFDEDNYVYPYLNTDGNERPIYKETANIFADGVNLIANANGFIEIDSQYVHRNIQANLNLLSDHLLEVTINCLSGDFEVYSVLLGGTFKDNPAPTNPVPEPTSLLLFAAGLAGLTAAGRKKNTKGRVLA